MSSEHSSEFECDEKQLLVHQSSGTTVINVDHGLATYTAASSATANTTGRTGGMPSSRLYSKYLKYQKSSTLYY